MSQNFSNEQDVRSHVKVLKSFYEEFSFYAIICLGLIVIWLLNGAGYFWPIWPIVIWGAPLLLKASKIGVISESIYNLFNHLRHIIPIFKPEWEEEKTQHLVYRHDLNKGPKVTTKAAPTAPKKVVKKAVKKVATKAKPVVAKAKAAVKKAAPAAKKVAPKVVAKAAKPAKKVVKKAAPKKAPAKKKK